MRMKSYHSIYLKCALAAIVVLLCGMHQLWAQETNQPQALERVEVEPPPQRTGGTRATSNQGFGYGEPTPAGEPISDYSLTPSQVLSPTRGVANIAEVPSAISVVETKGIDAQGKSGIGDLVKGLPGTWASGYAGNNFKAQIGIRGFSQTPNNANRVGMLLNNRQYEMPITDNNTGFLFPEAIERIEVMRGDGTVQFGNKAIGGSLNIYLKKPRQNPGCYFGVEGGSWRTQREWAGINFVKGPLAAGVFLGNYAQEGFRLFQGNGKDEEFTSRPGPWELVNFMADLNWKITPRVTLDITHLYTKQRVANPNFITLEKWDRGDLRNVAEDRANGGPDERWDTITTGQVLFVGDRIGNLDVTASYRTYDTQNMSYMFNTGDVTPTSGSPVVGTDPLTGRPVSYQRWLDNGLSVKYSRSDSLDFVTNNLTMGTDLYDGRFGVEKKQVSHTSYTTSSGTTNVYSLAHSNETSAYRGSLSYYVMNQTKLWDRIVLGLGHRVENYDFKDLFYRSSSAFRKGYPGWKKSASQYSLNVIYDRELGSSVYYKHARTYRFPTLSEMINTGTSHPDPLYNLGPEEGTLEECGIRHWFTPNVYVGIIYYELDMDNEILNEWDVSKPSLPRWTANVPLVAHDGVEIEYMLRLTPRWTLDGTFTKQKVIYRSDNMHPTNRQSGRLADKWVPNNPAQMCSMALTYENSEWGFNASIRYRHCGKRYFQGDDFNIFRDLEEVNIADLAISQTFFDGLATVYFGINNFNDGQSSFNTFWYNTDYFHTLAARRARAFEIWPDVGRTYYAGVKTNLDFQNMKVPSTDDLLRMQRRLYRTIDDGANRFAGVGTWIRGLSGF